MIASRRAASATGSPSHSPAESGPRCTSASLMARSEPAPGAPRADAMPQIPHIALAPRQAGGNEREGVARDREVEGDAAVRDVLEVVHHLLRPRHLAGEPQLREPRDAGAHDEPLPVG